jgi:hypothetical protein
MKIVLVHGWSVFDIKTYGELPARLIAESNSGNLPNVSVQSLWLAKYISFRDEVRIRDLARAFEAAIRHEVLADAPEKRFVCITHSTGGPIVRQWWSQYRQQGRPCPMSHLIMLAPANFGSALAQLGKSRLGRLRSWSNSIEPGQGVLDWLEHGSHEAWQLNHDWIMESNQSSPITDPSPVFPFVLTGQTIDRKLYDHLNSYTGEDGSDGTIRCAAANLNAKYVKLVQQVESNDIQGLDKQLKKPDRKHERPDLDSLELRPTLVEVNYARAARTAFRLIQGASHIGTADGILYSIKRNLAKSNAVVDAILRCLRVRNANDYVQLCDQFDSETKQVHNAERLETSSLLKRHFIHDVHAMAIVRICDDEGMPVTEFDFKWTGGEKDRPDGLPFDFLIDRQKNSLCTNSLTFFVNHDALVGLPEVRDKKGSLIREKSNGLDRLGLRVYGYPYRGIVRYYPALLRATSHLRSTLLTPNQTTLIDIVLNRILHRGSFEAPRFDRIGKADHDFRKQPPGDIL